MSGKALGASSEQDEPAASALPLTVPNRRTERVTDPMDDSTTTIQQLKDVVAQFAEQRDWEQFHTPKNLSMSIAIEAAELMEHFQWVRPGEVEAFDTAKKVEIGEELADVVSYCLAFASTMDIDVAAALEHKMARNREKYPAEKFKGLYGHDDPGFEKQQEQS